MGRLGNRTASARCDNSRVRDCFAETDALDINYHREKHCSAALENLSEEKENAYFADGIQDELLSNLAKVKDLKVISRTSVMQYKSGITRNLKEIAQQLGVGNVVEGVSAGQGIMFAFRCN